MKLQKKHLKVVVIYNVFQQHPLIVIFMKLRSLILNMKIKQVHHNLIVIAILIYIQNAKILLLIIMFQIKTCVFQKYSLLIIQLKIILCIIKNNVQVISNTTKIHSNHFNVSHNVLKINNLSLKIIIVLLNVKVKNIILQIQVKIIKKYVYKVVINQNIKLQMNKPDNVKKNKQIILE